MEPPTEDSAPVAGSAAIDERLARLEQRDERLVQALEALARGESAKPRRNWDVYAAVIASLVGLLALGVSGYTAYVQGQQLRAQVWPHVRLSFSGNNVKFMALNEGTGPAWIAAMRVTMDKVPMKTWNGIKKAAGFTEEFAYAMSSFSGTVLPPEKEFVLAEAEGGENSRAQFRQLFPGGRHELSITVCYCSILHECWLAESNAKEKVEDHMKAIDDGSFSRGECPILDGDRFKD